MKTIFVFLFIFSGLLNAQTVYKGIDLDNIAKESEKFEQKQFNSEYYPDDSTQFFYMAALGSLTITIKCTDAVGDFNSVKTEFVNLFKKQIIKSNYASTYDFWADLEFSRTLHIRVKYSNGQKCIAITLM